MKKFFLMRSKLRSKALTKFLLEKNCQIFYQPLINIKKIPVEQIKNNQLKNEFFNQVYSAVIITSQNAVEIANKLLLNRDIKIFTIGKKTALKLQQQGFTNIEYPKKYLIDELIKLILNSRINKKNKKIIYFRGENITVDLVKILSEDNFKVEELITYQANATKFFGNQFINQIKSFKNYYMVIMSIRSLENFFFLIKKHNLLEYLSRCNLIVISDKLALRANQMFEHGFRFKKIEIFSENEILKNYYE